MDAETTGSIEGGGASARTALEVVVLGTASGQHGMPPKMANASVLVRAGDTQVLIDAGAGVATRLRQEGVHPGDLAAIVLTHWHLDHVQDLWRIVRAATNARGGQRLPVYAPPSWLPTAWPTLQGLRGVGLDHRPVSAGDVVHVGPMRFTALSAVHVLTAVAWRIDDTRAGGPSLAVSGDTRLSGQLAMGVAGVDLYIREATFPDAMWERAWKGGHSTASDAALEARVAGVGALALTHMPYDPALRHRIEWQAQARFPATRVLRDGDVLSFGEPTTDGPDAGWGRIHRRAVGLPDLGFGT